MARIRWYLDEDSRSRALVQGLRIRGFDVLTPRDVDLMGAPDEIQLEFAVSEDRAIYTLNAGDFCRLHADYLDSGKAHAGIVVVTRQRYTVGQQVRGLSELTLTRSAEDMIDELVFLKV